MTKKVKYEGCKQGVDAVDVGILKEGCCSNIFTASYSQVQDFFDDVIESMKIKMGKKNPTIRSGKDTGFFYTEDFDKAVEYYKGRTGQKDKTVKRMENTRGKGLKNIYINEKNFGEANENYAFKDGKETKWWYICKKDADKAKNRGKGSCIMQVCTNVKDLYEKHPFLIGSI